MNDYDPDHFKFRRSSGLPHGTFYEPVPARAKWAFAALALAALGVIAGIVVVVVALWGRS